MAESKSGPFFYLSKVENAIEARLWDDIFTWTESQLGLPFGTFFSSLLLLFFSCYNSKFFFYLFMSNSPRTPTKGVVKSCVLIENVFAAFEMDAILYELRHHCIGLNAGILDYSASMISIYGT